MTFFYYTCIVTDGSLPVIALSYPSLQSAYWICRKPNVSWTCQPLIFTYLGQKQWFQIIHIYSYVNNVTRILVTLDTCALSLLGHLACSHYLIIFKKIFVAYKVFKGEILEIERDWLMLTEPKTLLQIFCELIPKSFSKV